MAEAQLNPAPAVMVRLAETKTEIEAAQALRYKVFYQEYNAQPTPEMARLERDFDEFDPHADHLIVVDSGSGQIVGTYRLLNREVAERYGQFYTSSEFDISPILKSSQNILELGRSCVLPEYRSRPVLQMLWQGIADYVLTRKIEMLFGCASFHGTDPAALARPLSYLYHNHLAPEDLRPVALPHRYVPMNILPPEELNAKAILGELPPLIKGYLRLGSKIGDGAVIDEQFGTIDVCIMLHTSVVAQHYMKHYERKHNAGFTAPPFLSEDDLKSPA